MLSQDFVLKRSYVPNGVQSRKRLLFCQPTVQILHQMHTSNYYEHRVRTCTGPGKPGSPGLLFWHFLGLESPGKKATVPGKI